MLEFDTGHIVDLYAVGWLYHAHMYCIIYKSKKIFALGSLRKKKGLLLTECRSNIYTLVTATNHSGPLIIQYGTFI